MHPPITKAQTIGSCLDQKLKYNDYIGNAVKRGVSVVLALKRVKNLKPEMARLLYNSTVILVTDYTSVIWAPNASQSVLKQMERVQRIRY